MESTPPQLTFRLFLTGIWGNNLKRIVQKAHTTLLEEFYCVSNGNIVATTSGAEIFLGIIRKAMYDENLDLGLSKFKVRETLKQQPEIAELIIEKAFCEAKMLIHTYQRIIACKRWIQEGKEYIKGLIIKANYLRPARKRLLLFV
ncbi:MAG: hypothetical protein AAF694_12980 [Bacteroidota bacterium]